MLWFVLTKKQVIVFTESHKHGSHQWNPDFIWDTRSVEDALRMVKELENRN